MKFLQYLRGIIGKTNFEKTGDRSQRGLEKIGQYRKEDLEHKQKGNTRRRRAVTKRPQANGEEDLSNEVMWKKQEMEGETQEWLTERKRKGLDILKRG